MPLVKEIEKEERYTAEDYFALPENAHTELIDGKFYKLYDMASPSFNHQKLLIELSVGISNYIKAHNGKCEVLPAPFMVQLKKEEDNYVEPDISVICDREKLTEKGCIGAPDWIIEIAFPSNSEHDYMRKLSLYVDAGVREYWIVDPECRRIIVYTMAKEVFALYGFEDKIPVGIFEDYAIDFAEISSGLL
ncbi:MAG: Uma2 family endonuclease [Lachnospiraceae bacterium]|nr:Uma2 family endonuclease [Lachnospiraceae bacterium]